MSGFTSKLFMVSALIALSGAAQAAPVLISGTSVGVVNGEALSFTTTGVLNDDGHHSATDTFVSHGDGLGPGDTALTIIITIYKSTVKTAASMVDVMDVSGGTFTHHREFSSAAGTLVGDAVVSTAAGLMTANATYAGDVSTALGELLSYYVVQTPNGAGSILETGLATTTLGSISWQGEYLYAGVALPQALGLSLRYDSMAVTGNQGAYTWTVSQVSEPASLALVVSALLLLGALRRRAG